MTKRDSTGSCLLRVNRAPSTSDVCDERIPRGTGDYDTAYKQTKHKPLPLPVAFALFDASMKNVFNSDSYGSTKSGPSPYFCFPPLHGRKSSGAQRAGHHRHTEGRRAKIYTYIYRPREETRRKRRREIRSDMSCKTVLLYFLLLLLLFCNCLLLLLLFFSSSLSLSLSPSFAQRVG